jgi:hypothetical protein
MARARSGGQAVKWMNRKFGSHTVKLLKVPRVKGRTGRWPEIVMLQVPGPAKKKLQSRNQLCEFLNEQDVFSKPARRVVRSVTLASACKLWYLIVYHGRTSTLVAVWAPAY